MSPCRANILYIIELSGRHHPRIDRPPPPPPPPRPAAILGRLSWEAGVRNCGAPQQRWRYVMTTALNADPAQKCTTHEVRTCRWEITILMCQVELLGVLDGWEVL